ncbi:MAG: imidazole glycerol phosphate synthase subunit HisH [Candidatus Lokiarchaeota archaeon]|nr:imidazole glycerol phosphate synthase subunit HisH [Candidatus Lokiarchaeota archaeon]
MTKILILDYGAGNLFSIKNALLRTGVSARVASVDADISCDGLVIPGVGHFGSAIESIKPAVNEIERLIESSIPVLGICLGLQLLFSFSEEGESTGLDIIKGRVEKLPTSLKTPHMGWNRVRLDRNSRILDRSLNASWFYFVHSYIAQPENQSVITGITDYGIQFPAIIEHGSIFATQFHPEKSGSQGFHILERFVQIAKEGRS